MKEILRVHLYISGIVQGVFFRAHTLLKIGAGCCRNFSLLKFRYDKISILD